MLSVSVYLVYRCNIDVNASSFSNCTTMLSLQPDVTVKDELIHEVGSDSDVEITHEASAQPSRQHFVMDKPHLDEKGLQPMDVQLRKAVALMLDAQNLHMTPGFLDQIAELASEYFHSLIVALQKFTELQRRRRPVLPDVELCFASLGINYNNVLHLHQTIDYQLTPKQREYSRLIKSQSDDLCQQAQDLSIEPQDPSYPFFMNEKYEITAVVPQHHGRPEYVPSHMPMLPPDYTYHRTPEFMPTISDLKTVRTKLVEESRMTEKWLYVLMKDDDKYEIKDTEVEVETNRISKEETEENQKGEWSGSDSENDPTATSESIDAKLIEETEETISTEQSEKDVIVKASNPKYFNIEAYIRRRIASKERRIQQVEERRRRRRENIFLQVESIYSPYATVKPTSDTNKFYDEKLDDAYSTVLQLVREGEKEKRRRLASIEEDKKRRQEERELQADTLEFGALGNIAHSDDSEEEDEGFPEFDFPTQGPTVEPKVASTEPETPAKTEEVVEPPRPTTGKKGPPVNMPAADGEHESSDDDLEADLEDALGNLGAMS